MPPDNLTLILNEIGTLIDLFDLEALQVEYFTLRDTDCPDRYIKAVQLKNKVFLLAKLGLF